MVKYLIIEDEPLAYKELKRMVDELRPDYLLTGWAQSVAQSVELLKSQDFDFILADISLADGLCFEIFEQTKADIPVIFTTAYDEYAIKAFKVNGVDYLLKPFEKEELALALERFERRSTVTSASEKVALLNGDYASSMPKTASLSGRAMPILMCRRPTSPSSTVRTSTRSSTFSRANATSSTIHSTDSRNFSTAKCSSAPHATAS